MCVAPVVAVLADVPGTIFASEPLDRPEAAQPLPLRFELPADVELDHLQKDTSAAGRYAAMEAADAARADYEDYFGGQRLAPGEFNWRAEPSKPAAMHIVVSIPDQRAYVYEGPVLIAVSTVSTGRRGHPTPSGMFPIIEKHRLKLSNLYDDAPMHYMQRLTMDGIALHAGYIPGVPASHGCIRLPMAFAQKLFSLTTSGTPVFISA